MALPKTKTRAVKTPSTRKAAAVSGRGRGGKATETSRPRPGRGAEALEYAYLKAIQRLKKDRTLTSSECSAGMIIPDGQIGTLKGIQVFVKVCLFSQELLKQQPLSGGLLCLARKGKR